MQLKMIYNKLIQKINYQVFANEPSEYDLIKLNQIHSDIIVEQTIPNNATADGFILKNKTNKKYAIITADCMPVVVIGDEGVCFVHAGWQGVQKKILRSQNINDICPHTFFIGPHIQSCCYEVSRSFKENFPSSKSFKFRDNKLFFNLFNQVKNDILKEFPNAIITNSNECTHCNKKYHSYRRDKTIKRNWNIISF